jgi:hypothetical protein
VKKYQSLISTSAGIREAKREVVVGRHFNRLWEAFHFVCNEPSHAVTVTIEIGKEIVHRIPQQLDFPIVYIKLGELFANMK